MYRADGEHQYLCLLRDLLENGDNRRERAGVGAHALFGREMRLEPSDSIPAPIVV